LKGIMHWLSPRKGFGYIRCEGGKDIFVHQTAIPFGASINEGDGVEFEQEESDRGPRAVEIRRL
jgi:CspA family cold shock protein